MRVRDYLKDRKFLILFYVIIMFFISFIIFLDHSVRVSFNNILYINFLCTVFFLSYLVVEFLYFKKYYDDLNDLINSGLEEIHSSLPNGITSEQRFYNSLLKNIYKFQNEKIEKLYLDKVENMEFITSWVHEIKTPIAVSNLIIENSFNKPMEDTLDSIEEELRKIDNYVEQALYYSKIDDFSKDYFINELSLDTVIKDLIKKNAKNFINKRIRLNMHHLEISVLSDKKWLVFIINQVLSNSLKYSKEGGSIEIYGVLGEKNKRLIIKDNGIGIKPEDLSRVFNKGFTGYNGRIYNKSTGMGLYLAEKMCKKLGHIIEIKSEYGQYTQVEIIFPKLGDYFKVTKM